MRCLPSSGQKIKTIWPHDHYWSHISLILLMKFICGSLYSFFKPLFDLFLVVQPCTRHKAAEPSMRSFLPLNGSLWGFRVLWDFPALPEDRESGNMAVVYFKPETYMTLIIYPWHSTLSTQPVLRVEGQQKRTLGFAAAGSLLRAPGVF